MLAEMLWLLEVLLLSVLIWQKERAY